jgi:uncharacterized membrane-anchored protein YitT (DUF2179 family)
MVKRLKLRQIGKIEQFVFLTVGVFIMAFAFYFFIIPASIVTGGVMGLALVVHRVTDIIPLSALAFIFNMICLLLAWVLLGKKEFVRSIYGSLMFPFFFAILETFVPVVTFGSSDLLLVSLYGGGLIGVGFAIVIHYGGTTGGTDILIKIFKKYTAFSLATCVYVVDGLVIVIGALTNPEGLSDGFVIALYAIVVVFLSGKVADTFLLGFQSKKALHIITDKPKELKEAIFANFGRGMTEIKSLGAYTEQEKTLLIMVIQNSEYHYIRGVITATDPKAFVYATPASEIHGQWSTEKHEVFINHANHHVTEKREEKRDL